LDAKERKAVARQIDKFMKSSVEKVNYELSAIASSHNGLDSVNSLNLIRGKANHKAIIGQCEQIYRTTGIVKNIID